MKSFNYSARFRPDVYAALHTAAGRAGVSINTLLDRMIREVFKVEAPDQATVYIRGKMSKAA